VQQIKILERLLYDPEAWPQDQVFAGHCLWTMYSRLRWRDSLWCLKITIDRNRDGEGFVETGTFVTKTSNSAIKKTTELPVVAIAAGLEVQDWPERWLELRKSAGLADPGAVDSNGYRVPIMPAVDSEGNFTTQPLSASAATKWLKELLSMSGDVSGISSHSLKSTLLSWCSKHGRVKPYYRKLLGYHQESSESSMHAYSRDVLAPALRQLRAVIHDVAMGKFSPDSTRSGYFQARADSYREGSRAAGSAGEFDALESKWYNDAWEMVGNKGDEAELVELEVDEWEEPGPVVEHTNSENFSEGDYKARSNNGLDDVPSDSDSESSSSPDQDVLLKDLVPCTSSSSIMHRRPAAGAGDGLYVHVRLCTLHKESARYPNRLACGRTISDGFRIVSDSDLERSLPKCRTCFGASDA
jgi:hypothetical protein